MTTETPVNAARLMAPKSNGRGLDLPTIATELMKHHDSEWEAHQAGLEKIEEWLRENPEEAVRLALPMLSNKLWDAIRAAARPRSGPSGKDDASGLRSVGEALLFNYVLPSGVKLGDVTRDGVERNRKQCARTAREAVRTAHWLMLIAVAMREAQSEVTVREHFSEQQLQALLHKAEQQVEQFFERRDPGKAVADR